MPEGEARCVGCGYEGSKKVIKDGLCPYCRDDEVRDDQNCKTMPCSHDCYSDCK